MDDGVPPSAVPKELVGLARIYPVSIVYTANIGPHRKLLPLLRRVWREDCVIITLDDDVADLLDLRRVVAELVAQYVSSGESSASRHARRTDALNLSFRKERSGRSAGPQIRVLPPGGAAQRH